MCPPQSLEIEWAEFIRRCQVTIFSNKLNSKTLIALSLRKRGSLMQYAASDTEPNLVALLDAAQSEPVFIKRGQQQVAVLLSVRDYNRLRGSATREFLDSATPSPIEPRPKASPRPG